MTRRECSPGAMMAATTMVTFVSSPVVVLIARWQDWAYGTAGLAAAARPGRGQAGRRRPARRSRRRPAWSCRG